MVHQNADLKKADSEEDGESADDGDLESEDDQKKEKPSPAQVVSVYDNRPEGYEGSCLRPLGFCDLGGCCDVCWYRPDNPNRKTS